MAIKRPSNLSLAALRWIFFMRRVLNTTTSVCLKISGYLVTFNFKSNRNPKSKKFHF